jgi:hypothetical protein
MYQRLYAKLAGDVACGNRGADNIRAAAQQGRKENVEDSRLIGSVCQGDK